MGLVPLTSQAPPGLSLEVSEPPSSDFIELSFPVFSPGPTVSVLYL